MAKRPLLDRCFKNEHGKLALTQVPNAPLITWLITVAVAWLLPSNSTPERLIRAVGFGAIFTWAWLELFQGANYFRRGLGLVVLLASVTAAVTQDQSLRYLM